MFTVNSYLLAVIFCIVTMICWGSWGNTQKLVSKNWRYELFYWDYVIGVLLFSVFSAFSLRPPFRSPYSFLSCLLKSSASLNYVPDLNFLALIFSTRIPSAVFLFHVLYVYS